MLTVIAAALLAAQPAEAPAASARANSDLDRMVCRQRPVTGSRTRFVRTCMTEREWANLRENITRGMRDHVTREMASQPPPAITPGSE